MSDSYRRAGETGCQNSGVVTSDTAVLAAAGKVYWLSASTESAARMQINDSTDDSGTDVWEMRIPDNGYIHVNFDPPIECGTGIYLDIPAGEPSVIVGYGIG